LEAINFEHVNKVLKADGCHDLPVCFDGKNIVFCWKLSLKERVKLLFTGKLWHLIWSNRCCIQPVCLEVDSPFSESPFSPETQQQIDKTLKLGEDLQDHVKNLQSRRTFFDGTGQFSNSASNPCRANCIVTKWNVEDGNGRRITEIQLDNGRYVSMPHKQMLSFLHFVEDDANE